MENGVTGKDGNSQKTRAKGGSSDIQGRKGPLCGCSEVLQSVTEVSGTGGATEKRVTGEWLKKITQSRSNESPKRLWLVPNYQN